MFYKLIYILPVITLLLFGLNSFFRKHTVQSYLLFVLTLLPLMSLKVTPEKYGAITVFDVTCIYALVFMFKEFSKINTSGKNEIYLILFILFISIVLLGGLASEFPDRAYRNTLKIIPIFIFGRFFITECAKDHAFHRKAIKALKISYFSALCFLFIQMIVGLKFTFYPSLGYNTIDPVSSIIRYPGVFFDSQASGQYLSMGSFLFLYFNDGAQKREKILSYLVVILAIIAITFAGSRSAFGGLAVGSLIVFLFAGKQYIKYGLAILVSGFCLFSLIDPQVGLFTRSKSLNQDYLFRLELWKEAYEVATEHPVLGIGAENYQAYVTKHIQDQYLEILPGEFMYFDQPENGYLKILVEYGFIGFTIFLLFIILPFIKGGILYAKNLIDNKVVFLFAALVCWLIAFNTVFSISDVRLLIMIASMLFLIICYPLKKTYHEELA